MKIKKIVIIEDEKPNADRLKRLLLDIRPDAEILAILDSVKESVAWLALHEKPDIIMMDVRLADGLSFEIFNHIEVKCPVIFTTAYDEYAVRAFKYNSIDYLLKPIEKEELETALNSYELHIQEVQTLNPIIENLLTQIQPKEFRNRFLLPYRDGYKTVMVSEVAFFFSELNTTQAHLFNGDFEIVTQPLEKLEQQLDPKHFFRANRQYIINMDSVALVQNYFNGKLKIVLKKYPDREVIISREKAPQFKNWMDY
ncbi:LytTR family DNA-binding domain-containing protein [Flavobacterium sp. CAU 1735]|uniref:LytR/AlgR family response regulator transcription factor n=1 Tax=Flavobacterium sp. CAU 1735 TaxID=3140361 RepID=UPI003260E5FD